jgi:hypothetical protein
MIPEDVKEKFEWYRKWFNTLVRKEFINLPSEHQKRFMDLLEKTKNECGKYYNEHKGIKEKILKFKIMRTEDFDESSIKIYGRTNELEGDCVMVYPKSFKAPLAGEVRHFMLYSLDGTSWYASKEELIIRGS